MCALVLAALGVGADFAARSVAEHELASRAQAATDAQSASADITGFPFLWDLVAEGSVDGVHIRLTGVPAGLLRLQSVDVQLTDTRIERTALIDDRQVRVRSIAAARATVVVTAAELSSAVGEPVSLPGDGRILVGALGRQSPASVSVEAGHDLVLRVDGVPALESNLDSSPLVPQCDLVLVIGTGQLSVSCQVAPVPGRLVEAIAGA